MRFLRYLLGTVPSLASGSRVKGYVDRLEDGVVEGWAADLRSPDPLSIDIEIDGAIVARGVVADRFRGDLRDAGIGNGRHGFRAEVANVDADAREVRLRAASGAVITARSRRARIKTVAAATNAGDPRAAAALSEQAAVIAPHFDVEHYLSQIPDDARPREPAVAHYLREGWKKGLDPAPDFSTRYYLKANRDVAAAGVNPFWHWVVAGRRERRPALPERSPGADALARLESLDARRARWLRTDTPPEPEPEDRLRDRIADALSDAPAGLLVAISHDDYRTTPGGVQLCLDIERRAARAAGMTHLAVHPWQPLPTLAAPGADILYMLTLDGAPIGACGQDTLARLMDPTDTTVTLAVHSLLGHDPAAIAALASRPSVGRTLAWLHDHLTLCPGFTLRRNDLGYCGVPAAGSAACGICVYGRERADHLARMRAFFEAAEIEAIAPSEFEAAFWRRESDLPVREVHVWPHIRILCEAQTPDPIPDDEPLRIAFAGWTASLKGWNEFLDMVRGTDAALPVEFHYFGTGDCTDPRIIRHEVTVRSDAPTCMRDRLAEARIDIVLHWAYWPETFSFTAHEAIAAGTLVVTSPDAGNIVALAGTCDDVVVHSEPRTLAETLTSGSIARLARARRKTRTAPRKMVFSGMSADFGARTRR